MKKLIVVVVVLSLTMTLSPTVVSAQSGGNSVLVSPWLDDEITVSPDQELILAWGWGACTPGLVTAFAKTVQVQWYLNGSSILPENEGIKYWGPVENRGPESQCLIGNGDLWGSSWRYSLGHLSVGVYQVSMTWKLDHQLLDGGDWNGDGHLEFFQGEVTDTITIYVES